MDPIFFSDKALNIIVRKMVSYLTLLIFDIFARVLILWITKEKNRSVM